MTIKIRGLLIFCGFLSCFGFLNATDKLNIGFIDMEAAIKGEFEAQKYQAELENEEQKLLADEEAARKSLETEMMNFQQQAPKMADKARADKENALRTKVASLQEEFNKRRMGLAQSRADKSEKKKKKNIFIAESIARKDGINLMLNSAAVLYASSELKKDKEKTAKQIAEYNKTYPVPKAKDVAAKPKDSAAKTPVPKK